MNCPECDFPLAVEQELSEETVFSCRSCGAEHVE